MFVPSSDPPFRQRIGALLHTNNAFNETGRDERKLQSKERYKGGTRTKKKIAILVQDSKENYLIKKECGGPEYIETLKDLKSLPDRRKIRGMKAKPPPVRCARYWVLVKCTVEVLLTV